VIEQLEVGDCVRERWICDVCEAGTAEIY
jgi:hypothetical protein